VITGLVPIFMTLMNKVQSNVSGNPLSESIVTNNGWLPKHQSLYGLICDRVLDVLANLISLRPSYYGTLKVWLHVSGHIMLDGLGFHKSVSLWLNTASVLTATLNERVWVGASLDTARWKVL